MGDSSSHEPLLGGSGQAVGRPRLFVNPWVVLAASMVLQLLSGVQYVVALWAPTLKEVFGYDQSQIQGMISPPFFVAVIGWLPGLTYDALARRHRLGPRVVIAIGLVLHFLGHFGLWLGATRRIQLSYLQVVTLAVVGLTGSGWVDTAAIVTSVRNFPRHRGSVVGILKAFVGLSGSVFTSVYMGAFKPHMLHFLLFLAIGPPVIGAFTLAFVNLVPPHSRPLRPAPQGARASVTGVLKQAAGDVRLQAGYMTVLLLAFYQLCTSAVSASDERSHGERLAFTAGTLTLVLPLLALPLRSGGLLWRGDLNDREEVAGTPTNGGQAPVDEVVGRDTPTKPSTKRDAFWLNVHAGGDPQTADAGASLKQPLRLGPVPVGCSEADPLLWLPLSSDAAPLQPRQRAAAQVHCRGQPAAATAQDLSTPHRDPEERQLASVCSVQPVPQQGQLTSAGIVRTGSGTQISAHRPAASSAPITIGGRQHDWWTLQLQEQRTGFVKQDELETWRILEGSGGHIPPVAVAAASDRRLAATAVGSSQVVATISQISAAAAAPAAAGSTPPSAPSSQETLSATPSAFPSPVSYIAGPAMLLHPSEPSSGAPKLLLVPSQPRDDALAAADTGGIAAIKYGDNSGLRSGSLVWLDDADGRIDSRGGGGEALQHSCPQHQCIITEEGPVAVVPDEPDASDLTPLQCAASLDFWLLFVVFGTGAGCGLLLINNLGELVQSLGGEVDGHDVFVSFFSVMNAVGRLAFGFFPERCLHSFGMPRTVWLVVACAMTAGVCTCTALAAVPAGLVTATLAGGASYGAFWGLMPAVASELFGLTHFATVYCALGFSTSVSAYLLATQLAGRLYAAASTAHGGDGHECIGGDCFGPAFLVAAGLACMATVLAGIIAWRTRGVYRAAQPAADPEQAGSSGLVADCTEGA